MFTYCQFRIRAQKVFVQLSQVTVACPRFVTIEIRTEKGLSQKPHNYHFLNVFHDLLWYHYIYKRYSEQLFSSLQYTYNDKNIDKRK